MSYQQRREGFEVDRRVDNWQPARSPVPIEARPLPGTQRVINPSYPNTDSTEALNRQERCFSIKHYKDRPRCSSLDRLDSGVLGCRYAVSARSFDCGYRCSYLPGYISARSDACSISIPHMRPGWKRPVSIRQSGSVTVPMVWGLFRPVILLPADADEWEPDQQRAVLLHELAHIQRQDWLMQTMAQITCAMYWFNPLVWFAMRRMRAGRRNRRVMTMCSTRGINQSTTPNTCSILCETLRRCVPVHGPAVTMARSSKIEGRLRTVLAENLNRRPVTKIAVAIGLLAFICFAVLMGVMRLTETAGPNDDPASLNEAYERKEQIYGVMVNGTRWRIHDLLRAELILGKPAPDFSHTSLHGSPVSLSVLRGKVVVLYYWSIEYDEADISQFKRLHKTHGENPDFVLISVCVQSRAAEGEAEVKQFVKTHAMPGLHLLLKPEAVPYLFAVQGWPLLRGHR